MQKTRVFLRAAPALLALAVGVFSMVPVIVQNNGDACGPNGYYVGHNGPAYERCNDQNHFSSANGCCYEG
jgi:hypothetical protein